MYLKSIEVYGFKSFANKITFQFHDGITAIVGPNGSGKSNVADAVRWVLGEQSARQLRGNKMEDVIFSGTQLRKPMGYAYVAITLDNSDHQLPIEYEEVTVARRVYRSGESEYLINGSACRLKDVQELFLDTGIGKEGYSIIGQGQIDKILSGKPEERRELFDEAAGIVKYKKRKSAAEKELAEEQLNFSRITDILSEIEKQVGPLQKQSEVAKEYLKLKEVLKKLEINLFLLEYEKNEKNKIEIDTKLASVTAELEKTKKAYENTRQEYDRLETELEQYSEKIEEKKEKRTKLFMMIQEKEGEIRLMKEKISSIQERNHHDKQRQATLLKEQEDKKAELCSKEKEIENVLEVLQKTIKQQEETEAEKTIIRKKLEDYAKVIEQCNQIVLQGMKNITERKTKLQHFATLGEQNEIKKSELANRILRHKSEEAEYEEKVEVVEKEYEAITDKVNDYQQKILQLEQKITEQKQKVQEETALIEQTERERIQATSKLDTLKNLSERYDGYGMAIRKVMERKADTLGIIGVVADIMKVDAKYETALEIALGGSIQNIVTKDEATAKEMVEYLKVNKLGRATFLPLTSITSKELGQIQEHALKEKGVLGYANTLVQVEKKYEELMKYLVGRTLVVDTMENALLLAKKYKYSLRIVTLEGEQLNPGGSISGGAYKNNSNLLSRRREIEQLEEVVEQCRKKVMLHSREREQLREIREMIATELSMARQQLQQFLLEQTTIGLQVSKIKEKLTDLKNDYVWIEQEVQNLELKKKEHSKNVLELQQQLKQIEDSISKANTKIKENNSFIEEEKRSEEKVSNVYGEIVIQKASLEQSLQFAKETKQRLEQEVQRLLKEEAQLKEENSLTKERIKEQEQAIETAANEIVVWKKQAEQETKTIETLDKKKIEITKGHKEFFSKREELSSHMTNLEKETYRFHNQRERLQEAMDSQADYMWGEYEVTVEGAKKYKDTTLPAYTGIKKEIVETKSNIKALGDVNVNAIEDYKNLSQRYELYTNQRQDLLEAEEALRKIIEQLDKEMRKQFQEKFTAIKQQFDVVFKELFGGGKGTLELIEDEDILTAGIRIIAQPPGKKLQNMMQLSGGEKALTAIALLFAIQNLKPSPFCLLDEIEAALDDSNVGRYAKYLHKLTKHTQFIVITHRRGTMAAANTLYGITMQEKGISTLVSVNLIENELE